MQILKEELRKCIFGKRMSLSKDEVTQKSGKIMQKLISLSQYRESTVIMCYMDFRNEVETREFIQDALLSGKRIALPVVIRDKNIIAASEVTSLENNLHKGFYGILEPDEEHIRVLTPQEIDAVIVPGVVFDVQKNRIGYGAGFYDRFLKLTRPDCVKIGVCFELQMVSEIQTDDYDVALDMLITEERIVL